jgi:hypothetical protein
MRHVVMASIADIRIMEVNESDDIKGRNRVALFPWCDFIGEINKL